MKEVSMNRPAAVSVTGKRRHGLGWLPWVAVLLLLAIAALIVLVVTNVSDENDEPGVDLRDDESTLVLSSPA